MTHSFLPWHPKTTFSYYSSKLILGLAGSACKAELKRHTVKIHFYDNLENHVLKRNKPVITVSNHLSTFDDPLLFGILPLKDIVDVNRMRITPAAQELTFDINSYFFNSGRLIPIIRGNGIFQKGMDHCVNELNEIEPTWIHLFPEGKINQNVDKCIRWKWGIARLILEAKDKPEIIPYAHRGLEKLMPFGPDNNNLNYIPTYGGIIEMAIGKPIQYKHLLSKCKGSDDADSRILLTTHLQNEFEKFRQSVPWIS